jgi:hypothetical protein
LNGLAVPADRAARRQLALAKTLIAFRDGLPASALEDAPPNPRRPASNEPTRPVAIEVLSAERTASDLTRFQGSDFGLRFSERAYRVRCGRKEWTLFINADVGSLAAADRLRSRPWLAGLLARWLPPDEASATQLVLLTRPDGAGVRLDVVRTDGEIIYTGTAQAAGPGLTFEVADVERPQTAPTSVIGVVSEAGVQLSEARVAQTRVAPRRAQAVRVEG